MAKKKNEIDYRTLVNGKFSIERVRELANLSKITINDSQIIYKRATDYLEYCSDNGDIPTYKGLCVALGVPSATVTKWLNHQPEHQTCVFINTLKDMMADNLENGALKGTLNNVASIFLLKSQHGYSENSEVTVTHKKSDIRTLEQLENEIENEIIDVEYSEKTENES